MVDRVGAKTFWTFVITSIALVMVTLDNLVVTTAIPVIRKDLHASLQSLEWTVNAYTLTFAVLLLTGAALGDRFGRRRLFVLGLGLFTGASAFAALAPSIEVLNIARALQGRGAPRRCGSGGAVRALGAPGRIADAADAVLPQPHLRAGERRLAADVLRDVRLDLPAGAVLPDRAGLLAAAGRPADPAVDGDADLHRADRRSALGSHPGPADHGRRARAAGDRPRLARCGVDADRAVL